MSARAKPARRNGVVRERYTAKAVKPQITAKLVELVRQANGDWTVVLDLEGSIGLPDGRAIEFKYPLRPVRAKQTGRKPHATTRPIVTVA